MENITGWDEFDRAGSEIKIAVEFKIVMTTGLLSRPPMEYDL